MNTDAYDQSVFRALADPSRRRILDLLRAGPQTTGQLTVAFDFTRFAVMKHLKVLEEAGLVLARKRGRERWNHLNAVPLQRVHERWIRSYEAEWAQRWFDLERVATRTPADGPKGAREMPHVNPSGEIRLLQIEQEIVLKAPRERVFDALLGDISAWWGRPHVQDTDRVRRISIEPKIGGHFWEEWSDDEGSLWGTVTNIKKNERLMLSGPMAMSGAVHGVIRFDLEDAGEGQTRLRFSHRAMGEVNEELQQGYDAGWTDLLATRLRAWVETETKMGLGHEAPKPS